MIILACVAGLAILCLTALCLRAFADGQERMRMLAPRIRVVSPPKPGQQDEAPAPVTGGPSHGEASS